MKQIKFNIMSGNVHCRNISDLKENFNIHDVLNAFENGILEKWFLSQKLDDIYNKVLSIDKLASDSQKLESLIKIIYEDENEDFINNICRDALSVIDYESGRKSELENINNFNIEKEKIIDSYFKEYDDLIQHIIDNKKNYDIVKEGVRIISDKFYNIFKYSYVDVFNKFKESRCLFGILSVLANENIRMYLEEFKYDIQKMVAGDIQQSYFSPGWEKEEYAYLSEKLKFYSAFDTKGEFYTLTDKKSLILFFVSIL
ncbi:hypothetical protein [Brachyspira hampsonii]|uniref:hypothetical protein n=1 Tax=Brachyspira hampsonii TaxID=1287055 RepID=UPI0002AE2B05|nr:hypothetical protein [Brachyspira hampsonii]ELV07000.1 hypothetical protein H263_00875 [Brachyspira hampsonii 30599]